MADVVRTLHDLTALRCRMDIRERTPVVVSQVFRGGNAEGDAAETPLPALGLPEVLTPRSVELERLSLEGTAIAAQLQTAAEIAQEGAIWLQIGRDARKLAALPWEGYVASWIGKVLLRVPNFLVNPFEPRERMRLALCASGPRAKGEPSVLKPVLKLLSALDPLAELPGFGTRLPQIEIFANADAYEHLQNNKAVRSLAIVLHDPTQFEGEVPPRVMGAVRQTRRVENPWLKWMASVFGDRGVDAVHFVSPGYFFEENGALALAETPTLDEDPAWSRFVGGQELAAFYDQVGCTLMGFTAIGSPPWVVGLRMLANELSWLRPGPIMLEEQAGSRALANAYGALLRRSKFEPQLEGGIQFHVHPDALVEIEDIGPLGAFRSDIFNESVLSIEREGKGLSSSEMMARIDRGSKPGLFSSHAPPLGDPRQDFIHQVLRSEGAKLSSVRPKSKLQAARDTGAMRALDFISRVTQGD